MRKKFPALFLGVVIGMAVSLALRGKSPSPLAVAPGLAERELDRKISRVDLTQTPFDRAVADIQKLTTARIEVDWKSLKTAAFDPHLPVTIRGDDVYLWQVLQRLTGIASRSIPGGPTVSYDVLGSRITIGIADGSATPSPITARLYDVSGLAVNGASAAVPTPPAPTVAPATQQTNLFAGGPTPPDEALAQFIRSTVAPETWVRNGGVTGRIQAVGDHLLVATTPLIHRDIAKLLAELRRPPPPLPLSEEKQWSDAHDAWISPDVTQKLESQILTPIDAFDLEGVPFREAVDRLQKLIDAPIEVDFQALEKVGAPSDSPVTVHARQASLSAILQQMLSRPVGGLRLDFAVHDGVIEIGTLDDVAGRTLTRIYDIRDQRLRVGPRNWPDEADALLKLLQDTIDPGGAVGSMHVLNGALVITQTWRNHQAIAATLAALRRRGWVLPNTRPSDP